MFAGALPSVADESDTKKKVVPHVTPKYANREFVEKDDPDYLIQGEYVGNWTIDGASMRAGIQVKALGRGKFQMHVLPGGLTGDGWTAKTKKIGPTTLTRKKDAKTAEGVDKQGNTIVIQDGKLTGTDKAGKQFTILERVERKSKTEGMKPPKGAVVLFDGTNADGWRPVRDRKLKKSFPPLTDKGHLLCGTKSTKMFQSCKLHLEFRVPWEPTKGGQGRGNSGVYMQQRYEVQVLDSFGDQPNTGHCGGIYIIAKPAFVMSYPPLQWQTYDIEFTKAEFHPTEKNKKGGPKRIKDAVMSVWHNGVQIHKDVKIFREKTTAAPKSEGPNPQSIFFQNHGHWVVYRNVWVVEK
jgi:hypothetical protein